ncbi:class I SAM-dependent methyltransferase [Alteromonas flava]|uniref:class I SAM-dependent methyltransferase n=1 Tax=Alteromonas flava TaxID=2048003 RepID=UPI000C287EDA|nr:class I SAM-dependent methyltransferase [Alteromonas flava]
MPDTNLTNSIPVINELPNDHALTIEEQLFSSYLVTVLANEKWHLANLLDDALALVVKADGLALRNLSEPKQSDVSVDFLSPALAYRQAKGGGKSELLVKAIGIKGAADYHVIDATAGLGTDAFVLASAGCQVTMLERSPVVAALLFDALTRLEQAPANSDWQQRLKLQRGDSVALLSQWPSENTVPDAIYLDPMFPHRKKSALVKKEMQALQKLLGVDPDADALLAPAIALAKKRVVVKRPASAPYLAERKPNLSMSSKKHRFDIYLT